MLCVRLLIGISTVILLSAEPTTVLAQSQSPDQLFVWCRSQAGLDGEISNQKLAPQIDECMLGSRFTWSGNCKKEDARKLECYTKLEGL